MDVEGSPGFDEGTSFFPGGLLSSSSCPPTHRSRYPGHPPTATISGQRPYSRKRGRIFRPPSNAPRMSRLPGTLSSDQRLLILQQAAGRRAQFFGADPPKPPPSTAKGSSRNRGLGGRQ